MEQILSSIDMNGDGMVAFLVRGLRALACNSFAWAAAQVGRW